MVVILEAPLNPPWRKILRITLIVVTVLVLLGFTGIFGANPYFRVRYGMPVKIEKLPGDRVQVSTPGGIKAKATSFQKAMAQKRLL